MARQILRRNHQPRFPRKCDRQPYAPDRPTLAGAAVKIFRKIWSGDFEFQRADNRDPPVPVCLVARELHSKREVRLFQDELAKLTAAPFDTGPDACFVSFAVAAEASCFAALGWPMPANNIDLYAENLLRLNGRPRRQGDASLLGAMGH